MSSSLAANSSPALEAQKQTKPEMGPTKQTKCQLRVAKMQEASDRRATGRRVNLVKSLNLVALLLLGVMLLLSHSVSGKTHHSKRQAGDGQRAPGGGSAVIDEEPAEAEASQREPTGRESSNWWNLWWQQYIGEASQPTVRPIVAVSFNGRTINLSDQPLEGASEPSVSSMNLVRKDAARHSKRLAANGNSDNSASQPDEQADTRQLAAAQRKSQQQQIQWQSVKPKIIEPMGIVAQSRDLRINRQASDQNMGIQMRANMVQQQQQPAAKMPPPRQQQQQQQVAQQESELELQQQQQLQHQMLDYSEEADIERDNQKAEEPEDDSSSSSMMMMGANARRPQPPRNMPPPTTKAQATTRPTTTTTTTSTTTTTTTTAAPVSMEGRVAATSGQRQDPRGPKMMMASEQPKTTTTIMATPPSTTIGSSSITRPTMRMSTKVSQPTTTTTTAATTTTSASTTTAATTTTVKVAAGSEQREVEFGTRTTESPKTSTMRPTTSTTFAEATTTSASSAPTTTTAAATTTTGSAMSAGTTSSTIIITDKPTSKPLDQQPPTTTTTSTANTVPSSTPRLEPFTTTTTTSAPASTASTKSLANETATTEEPETESEENEEEDSTETSTGSGLLNSAEGSAGNEEDDEEEGDSQEEDTSQSTPVVESTSQRSTQTGSASQTASSAASTVGQQPMSQSTMPAIMSMTTMDIERLPVGSTETVSTTQRPKSSITTTIAPTTSSNRSVMSSSPQTPASIAIDDIARIQPIGMMMTPIGNQGESGSGGPANFVMMTIGGSSQANSNVQSSSSVDQEKEEMPITMPMDTLMKMVSQAMSNDGSTTTSARLQQAAEMSVTRESPPASSASKRLQPPPPTTSLPVMTESPISMFAEQPKQQMDSMEQTGQAKRPPQMEEQTMNSEAVEPGMRLRPPMTQRQQVQLQMQPVDLMGDTKSPVYMIMMSTPAAESMSTARASVLPAGTLQTTTRATPTVPITSTTARPTTTMTSTTSNKPPQFMDSTVASREPEVSTSASSGSSPQAGDRMKFERLRQEQPKAAQRQEQWPVKGPPTSGGKSFLSTRLRMNASMEQRPALTGEAIRQFGGANRMSMLGQQPVAFGRPAAMMGPQQQVATKTGQRAKGGAPVFVDPPSYDYGPAMAVRRPDEPMANGQVPNCTLSGKNFCVLTKDYPMNEVRQAVERSFRSVRLMYEELQTVSDQELHKDDFRQTSNSSAASSLAASGKFACQTQVEMMRPGWARDEISREWMLVVNTDVFPQRVRTESCAQPNEPCEFIAPFYDSTCQQRYSLHRMIAIDPHDPRRSPQVAVFRFPAGCVCRVHPIRKTSAPTSASSQSSRRR